ncbi:MAG: tetraacyldisaccharide 4'-kinase [Deltaproteobacteria bacterium]|nr:tetraacyldisaccharide 4'-kinase [Deltaproteobacteria bacterium]
MDWSRIHYGEAPGWALRPLSFLSFLYGLGVQIKTKASAGRARKSLPGFVVSVGNITTGGTGKTPAAIMLAKWAQEQGFRVAILTRGYGGRYREKVLEVIDATDKRITPAQAGDEAFLLSRNLKGIPIMISRDRYLAGSVAREKYDTNFHVLDDGFQHVRLKRDLDLVLLDASSPFGNGYLLPLGPLREPIDHLRRADAFLLTRCGEVELPRVLDFLGRKFPKKPVFEADHIPEQVVVPLTREAHAGEWLRGKAVIAFAGIARPAYFRETLEQLGAEVVLFKAFRDHHSYRIEELRHLAQEKDRQNADLIITTEKDWVRVEHLGTGDANLAYLTVRFRLSDQDRFFAMIKNRINL